MKHYLESSFTKSGGGPASFSQGKLIPVKQTKTPLLYNVST